MKKIINLTPHTLNIFKENGSEIIVPKTQVSEVRYLVLRCSTQSTIVNIIDGIEIAQTSFGELEIGTVDKDGMDFIPDSSLKIPTDGDLYVVSMICLNKFNDIWIDQGHGFQPLLEFANIEINKFFAPGSLIKKDGVPVGCKGLSKL